MPTKSISFAALLLGSALSSAPASAKAQEEERQQYNMQTKDLGDALLEVARKADLELYASSSDLEGKSAPPLRGNLTARQAVENLLSGSGLTARFHARSIIISRSEISPIEKEAPTEAIVVTGSRIEGAPPAAPVIALTSEDIKNGGFADLGEVARSLPQNFGGGQNPGIAAGQGIPGENANVNGASTFNLRGIGPNATLTLLNGNRFAHSGNISVLDVSAIPMAAVERVEIVTDGASAIYGADAVAGVVNILLRKDYEGVTTSARIGGSTDGGNFQQQYSVLAGTKWSSGGFIAAYDHFDNNAVTARQRSYAGTINPASTIYPELERHNILLSGHQQLTPGIRVMADLIYKRGNMRAVRGLLADRPVETRGSRLINKFETFGVAPSLEAELGGGWTARLTGFYGTDDTLGLTDNITNGVAAELVRVFDNRNGAAEAGVEGPLFALPAGDVRLAAGAGWRRNEIDVEINRRHIDARRENIFAYGELFVPLAEPAQDIAGAHRASITAALRWEDYSDAGSIVTPKLGFVYAPSPELSLGVSWGRSFKMPTLYQQYSGYVAILYPVTGYGTLFPPGSTYVALTSSKPDIGPERSENLTLSATFRPSPRLQIVTSLFKLDYRDRVAPPFASPLGALTNPLYANLVTGNPTSAELEAAIGGAYAPLANATSGAYNPANVVALLDGRDRNIAEQRYQGADLSIRYRAPMGEGRSLTLTAGATWLDSRQRLLPGLPSTDLAGTIFNPPHFRARGGASFESDRFTLSSFVNFTGGVTDNRRAIPVRISPVATVDLTARVKIADLAELSLSALNIFNAKPEQIFVAGASETPFDTTNYSAAGRFLGVTISRDW
jgi:outer membrane receptor protein involved in Fe transport